MESQCCHLVADWKKDLQTYQDGTDTRQKVPSMTVSAIVGEASDPCHDELVIFAACCSA